MPATPGLWPHQREAVEAICKVLHERERVVLHMACGTGKTRVGGEIAQRLRRPGRGRSLLVVPSLELIRQTLREWVDVLGHDALGRLVAVCSQPGILQSLDRAAIMHDAAVTGDPAELAALVRDSDRVTVACTYQSLDVLVTAHARHELPRWNAVIIDEAHRTVGEASRPWALVHDQRRIPADRRVSMTATPRIAVGEGRMIGMQDEHEFGPVGYRLPFGTAIELGLLARYRIVVPVVTDEQIRRTTAAGERPEFLNVGTTAISAGMLATQMALLRAARQYDSRRIVTFHTSVDDARWFARTLPLAREELALAGEKPPQLWAGHVHGEQSMAQRRRVLDHLRAADERVVVVANAKLLTEGVDIPEIDAVCFLHPRSPIDTIQAVGRALRRGDRGVDKTATIIVPVLLGPGEDPETALSGSAYATVFAVVRALAAHDDSLAHHLDRARQSLGTYTEPETRRGLPQWLTFHGIDVPPGFAHAITVRAIRESTDSWAEYLAAAATYRTDNGGSLRGMPRGWTTPRGLPLWRWLQTVKERYREGRLSPEQITDMEALGIVWNPHDHAWRQFVTDLKAYLVDHPDLDVPTNYTNPAGRNLGQTVAARRSTFARLPAERARELLDLGFILDPLEERWKRCFDAWVEYRQTNGHPAVPLDHVTADGIELGKWRSIQLEALRQGTMPRRRITQIKQHNLLQDARDVEFHRHLAALRLYVARERHAKVPGDHVENGIPLGRWLIYQRVRWRKGILDPRRAALLQALGVRP